MDGLPNSFAFPGSANTNWGIAPEQGMTLRDYFAAQAPITLLDAAIACGWPGLEAAEMHRDEYRATLWAVMTLMRFEYADAMLLTRTKGGAA